MSAEVDRIVAEEFAEALAFRYSLNRETDRGCALNEYLSDELADLLRANLVDDAKVCSETFDNTNGAMAPTPCSLMVATSPD